MHNDKPAVSLHLFGFYFTPKVLPTLLTALLIPVFISMGVWQLHRAEFKRTLSEDFAQRKHHKPLNYQEIKQPNKMEFYPVTLSGELDDRHQLLVENQFYQHQVGYQVLTPLHLENGSVVMINRGWAPQHTTNFNIDKKQQTVKGFIWLPHQHVFSLGQAPKQNTWPKLIPNSSWEQIQRAYTIEKLQPFMLMADAGQAFSYQPNYHPTTITPQKHMGYAIQWFGFAIALFIIFLVVNTHRSKSKKT